MKRINVRLAAAAFVVLLGFGSVAAAPRPVVLELFTSHGCSSCPPADALLRRLHRDAPGRGIEVIALSEHVDYWDDLGWPDRFSKAQFSARQRTYVGREFGGAVFTPALVINGRTEVVGSHARQVRAAVRNAAGQASLPVSITLGAASGQSVRAEVHLPDRALRRASKLWLALTEDHAVSPIGGGENQGRTLTEDGVVRALKPIATIPAGGDGPVKNYAGRLRLPDGVDRAKLTVVAFIQNRSSLAIIGAASQPLQ